MLTSWKINDTIGNVAVAHSNEPWHILKEAKKKSFPYWSMMQSEWTDGAKKVEVDLRIVITQKNLEGNKHHKVALDSIRDQICKG